MGWASGSQLAEELYEDIRRDIPAKKRRRVARMIVEAFENHDADDWDLGGQLHRDADLYKECGCEKGKPCDPYCGSGEADPR